MKKFIFNFFQEKQYSTLYSIWSIIRLIIITIVLMGMINLVPIILTGKLSSELFNYSIAISLFLGVLIDIKWIEKKPLAEVGLCFRIKDLAFFGGGILLAVLICGFCLLVVSILRGENMYPLAIAAVLHSKRGLLAFLVIPFSEEIFHRGYFLGHTFQKLSYWKRSVLSALLFSLSHWLGTGYSSFFMLIFAMGLSTFLFGIIFNNLRWLTGSIWLGFSLHWFFNFIFGCTFLDNENYDIAVLVVFLTLATIGGLTSRWIQRLQKQQKVGRWDFQLPVQSK